MSDNFVQSQYRMDFGPFENGDVLDNFDFDSFLQDNDDSNDLESANFAQETPQGDGTDADGVTPAGAHSIPGTSSREQRTLPDSEKSHLLEASSTPHRLVGKTLIEPPSLEFLNLYHHTIDYPTATRNEFETEVTRDLTSWSLDNVSLSQATNGLVPQQVFIRLPAPLDSMKFPAIDVRHVVNPSTNICDQVPQWKYLTTRKHLAKGSIAGELRGRVGSLQSYRQSEGNNWSFLRHPASFVFFHPTLPIYIDTRTVGSKFKYVRRSCRPNTEMKTVLEEGSTYRFIFVVQEAIPPGGELTIPWTYDEDVKEWLRLLKTIPTINYRYMEFYVARLSDWAKVLLSNFGGCACESPESCKIAQRSRRTLVLP